jgi:endo-1,4-beta-D-glucanase Y
MMLAAYMNDKAVFDGLYKVTRIATSHRVSGFMAWRLYDNCAPSSSSDWQSATDGDLDIAYALLLADRQWGSGGGVDYRGRANDIIWSLAEWGLSDDQSFIPLGDWVHAGSGVLRTAMRPSDFMPDHFRAFRAVTGDDRWQRGLDNIYGVLSTVQNKMGGLVPDFIVDADGDPSAAPGQVLETAADGTYGVNACRVPWRVGVDYLVNGDSRAKNFASWLTSEADDLAGGTPGNFVGKYYSASGSYYSTDTRGALFYTGPLGVGAMAGTDQSWLNALWEHARSAPKSVYYQDTIRVLSMVAMSGNWWSPHKVACD